MGVAPLLEAAPATLANHDGDRLGIGRWPVFSRGGDTTLETGAPHVGFGGSCSSAPSGRRPSGPVPGGGARACAHMPGRMQICVCFGWVDAHASMSRGAKTGSPREWGGLTWAHIRGTLLNPAHPPLR